MSESNEFTAEGQELIETFSRLLFEIEEQLRDGEELDPDRVNESFRSIHTLKSLAGLAGSDPLKNFAHEIETTLDALRLGKARIDGELINLLFEATNAFEQLLGGETCDTRALLGKLERRLGTGESSDAVSLEFLDPGTIGVLSEFEEHRLRENVRLGRRIFQVRVEFELLTFGDGLEALKTKLKQHGEVVAFLPSGESSGLELMAFAVLVGSTDGEAEIAAAVAEQGGTVELLHGEAEAVAVAEPDVDERESQTRGGGEPGEAGAAVLDQTVRVDLRRLDGLMNLVGELALVHANLRNYGDRIERGRDVDLQRELLGQLRTMSRRVGQLQQGILDVRMVPIRQTFESVKRMVHRTARKLDKQIELVLAGTETELDKQIGERLSKPLVHMVNNAIAHGIEGPAERVAVGKPRVGRIELNASQKGNRVVIEITDDGNGIDWQVIRDKALAKGVISREEAVTMDPGRAINLIFKHGFSSKDEADDTSGRGVGMDVVKTEIAKLSGLIDVATEPGRGSRFRITLPSTLAIIQALVIESGGQTFCIQLNSVLESLMVQDREIQTIEGCEVVSVRGRTLPLINLARVFELDGGAQRTPGRAAAQRYVVVVGLAEHRVGLVVDELLGQQDVVIKPIGRKLAQIPGIAGATELGDNRTVLLLDVATLVSEAVGGVEAMVAGTAMHGSQGIRVSTRLDR